MELDEKELIKIFGYLLRFLREDQGLSLNIFAYENDMTTATVSRVENGLVDTKFSTLVKYSKGLGMPLEQIVSLLNVNYIDDDM